MTIIHVDGAGSILSDWLSSLQDALDFVTYDLKSLLDVSDNHIPPVLLRRWSMSYELYMRGRCPSYTPGDPLLKRKARDLIRRSNADPAKAEAMRQIRMDLLHDAPPNGVTGEWLAAWKHSYAELLACFQ